MAQLQFLGHQLDGRYIRKGEGLSGGCHLAIIRVRGVQWETEGEEYDARKLVRINELHLTEPREVRSGLFLSQYRRLGDVVTMVWWVSK